MIINTDLSLNHEIQTEILPDEKQLWVGKPKTGIQFRSFYMVLIPFVLWVGFLGFWFISFFLSVDPWFLLMLGIPFLCIGLYFAVRHCFFDNYKRRKMVYVVTDKRIIINTNNIKGHTLTLNIKNLQDVIICEKRDGSGTIHFNSSDAFPLLLSSDNRPRAKRANTPAFEFITDVRAVYNLIIKQQTA